MTGYTHICLVSAQPSPTLAPLLSEHYRPERVVLVVTPQQERQAGLSALENVLSARHIRHERLPVPTAWDTDVVTGEIEKLLQELPADAVPILNATGGTKPMSTGAFMACFNHDVPVYYVNVDKLSWLYVPETKKADFQDVSLSSGMSLKALVEAHGANVISMQRTSVSEARQKVAYTWLKRAQSQAGALGALNGLADRAEQTLSVEQQESDIGNKALQVLLEELAEAGLLTVKGRHVTFRSEEARAFANGHWLEEVVYHELEDLRTKKKELGIQDVARSVKVDIQGMKGAHAEQEIDVALLAGNRLHLIECKTGKLTFRDSTGDSKAEDALFKLAAIKDHIGGSSTRGMLVSYRKVRATDKERAPILGLQVTDIHQSSDLRSALCQWLRPEGV